MALVLVASHKFMGREQSISLLAVAKADRVVGESSLRRFGRPSNTADNGVRLTTIAQVQEIALVKRRSGDAQTYGELSQEQVDGQRLVRMSGTVVAQDVGWGEVNAHEGKDAVTQGAAHFAEVHGDIRPPSLLQRVAHIAKAALTGTMEAKQYYGPDASGIPVPPSVQSGLPMATGLDGDRARLYRQVHDQISRAGAVVDSGHAASQYQGNEVQERYLQSAPSRRPDVYYRGSSPLGQHSMTVSCDDTSARTHAVAGDIVDHYARTNGTFVSHEQACQLASSGIQEYKGNDLVSYTPVASGDQGGQMSICDRMMAADRENGLY